MHIIDDEDFEYESDDEVDGAAAAPSPAPATPPAVEAPVLDTAPGADDSAPGADDSAPASIKPLHMTTSFVQSMSEYAFRRELMVARIKDGALVANLTPSKEGAVDKRQQVNLEFYSDDNQARRRHIKKHPQFVAIVTKLWNCVDLIKDESGCLTKEVRVGEERTV